MNLFPAGVPDSGDEQVLVVFFFSFFSGEQYKSLSAYWNPPKAATVEDPV